MKKLLSFVLFLVFAASLAGPAHAEKEKIPATEAISAIDVADLLKSGSSDAEIAKVLSGKQGFDREAALKKGQSDQQIINYLITGTVDPGTKTDNNKSIRHKFEGDKYLKESKYGKAAAEYTLAIMNSKDNQALYKLRGDSYKQYLVSKLPVSSVSGKDETNQASLAGARKFLCGAIHSDYRKALEINKTVIEKNNSSIKVLENQMTKKDLGNVERSDVAPYHKRAAGNIHGMREMDRLYRSQRSANHFNLSVKKAMSEYKSACREEDEAFRKSLKADTDSKRDKK